MRTAILGIVAIVAIGSLSASHAVASLAPASPESTATCDFPSVSTARLREIRDAAAAHPVPTPTTSSRGLSTSELHHFAYPPRSGDPLDDSTLASIRAFIREYSECIVLGEILPVYGAWSDAYLQLSLSQHPETIDPIIDVVESGGRFPHPGLDLLLLRAWQIESGHVIAIVQIVPTPEFWTLYLAQNDESWRIDDIWDFGDRLTRKDPIDDSLSGPVYATPVPSD